MGRYGFQLNSLPASRKQARAVQEIVYQDFAALTGMSEEDARSIADPTNEHLVSSQYAAMDGDPTAYLGVNLKGMLFGVVKVREWLYGDEQDFFPITRTLHAKIQHKIKGADISSQGLHVLARSPKIRLENRSEATAEMLDLVVDHARALGQYGIKNVTSLSAAVDLKDYALQSAFDQYPSGSRDGLVAPVTLRGVGGTAHVTRTHVLREAQLD